MRPVLGSHPTWSLAYPYFSAKSEAGKYPLDKRYSWLTVIFLFEISCIAFLPRKAKLCHGINKNSMRRKIKFLRRVLGNTRFSRYPRFTRFTTRDSRES